MKIGVAQEGQSFTEKGLYIDWPRGGGTRGSATVPDNRAKWSARLRREFERGKVVEVDAPAKPTKPAAPRRRTTKKPT
jgi:hypothetical protein